MSLLPIALMTWLLYCEYFIHAHHHHPETILFYIVCSFDFTAVHAPLLHPKLEYCGSVWDPHKGVENNGSHNLEMVQWRATRWALGRYQQLASMTEMLKELNWQTLEQRRVDAFLNMLYKITNNFVAVNPGDNLSSPTRRRHVHDLRKKINWFEKIKWVWKK